MQTQKMNAKAHWYWMDSRAFLELSIAFFFGSAADLHASVSHVTAMLQQISSVRVLRRYAGLAFECV